MSKILFEIALREGVATKASLTHMRESTRLVGTLAFLVFETNWLSLRCFGCFAPLPVPRRHQLAALVIGFVVG